MLRLHIGLAVLLFWSSYLADARVANTLRTASVEARPMLLNGLRFPVHQAARDDYSVPGPPRWTLVFYGSDTCPFCVREQERWLELVKTLPLQAADSVVLLSLDSGRIFDPVEAALESRHNRALRVNAAGSNLLRAALGITSTPMTLIVDRNYRVRLVAPNLTPTAAQMIRERFVN